MKLIQALETGVVLGDGANGTWLSHLGFRRQPYDMANVEAPDLVRSVHREYFDAGADFVETNTYSANALKLEDLSVDIREVNLAGARLAREAAGAERIVLGAIGPSGRSLAPIGRTHALKLKAAFKEQATALVEGGVDGFFLETFGNLDELRIAVDAVRQVCELPILVSKAFIEDGEALAEGLPTEAAAKMSELDVVAVGANCIVGPQRMLDLVRMMGEGATKPLLALPAPGLPQIVKGEVVFDTSPQYFAKAVYRLAEEGARIVGGCCGTTPAHIAALRAALDAKKPKVKVRASVVREPTEKEPVPVAARSAFAGKIGQKFLTAVEMDVPRGLKIDKLLAGAKALKEAGVDAINISDGARARLRMNPAAVANLIQTQVGVEVVMHFSCRDRNVLAIQADLLGCHALGIRNVLSVTGDPTHIGDYPSATSVFDIDAVGLIRILGRFNEGVDLAGYGIGMKCGFTICCAYNPLAIDPELERDRLRRKVEAGAELVYTQPVFDSVVVAECLDVCGAVGVPVMIGVLPLRNQRHCEFMHNEVPGIQIPERLRAAIASAHTDDDALKIGIDESRLLAAKTRELGAQGIYIMPPFGRAAIAKEVMEAALA